MICIIAGNETEAEVWAKSQFLARNEWFFPGEPEDLLKRTNFHVIVIGTGGMNVPVSYFEKIYSLAQQRGSIGRT